MRLETDRLKIYTTSKEEMINFIGKQTNEVLKAAYNEMLQGCLSHPEQWEWYAIWFITLKDGQHIGELSFKGINSDGSAEIGYGISDNFQGNGYATEAVNAAVSWALKQPGIYYVTGEAEPDNTASQRVMEKCGFVATGTLGEEGPRYIRK